MADLSNASVPASLAAIAVRVETRLREFLEPEQARWATFDPELAVLVREVLQNSWDAARDGWHSAHADVATLVVADQRRVFATAHAVAALQCVRSDFVPDNHSKVCRP